MPYNRLDRAVFSPNGYHARELQPEPIPTAQEKAAKQLDIPSFSTTLSASPLPQAQNFRPHHDTKFELQNPNTGATIIFLSRWHTYPTNQPQSPLELHAANRNLENTFIRTQFKNSTDPSIKDFVDRFKLTPGQIRFSLGSKDGRRVAREKPKVTETEISPEEKAFFTGLFLTEFSVEDKKWDKENFMVVSCTSENPKRQELLKKTIGIKGEVIKRSRDVKVYLPPKTFSFLSTKPDGHYLQKKDRFAPFFYAFLLASLSDTNRLSHENPQFIESLARQFEQFYGFRLGRIKHEKYKGKRKERKKRYATVFIENPGGVFAALFQEKSVQGLPFINYLRELATTGF